MIDLSRIRLPERPLRVTPPGLGFRGMARFLVALLAMLGLIAGWTWWLLPEALADVASRERARPVAEGRVEAADCSVRLFLVTCRFTLAAPLPSAGMPGGEIRDRSFILFADLPDREYDVTVLADPARPGELLSSLALKSIWNRLGTYLLVAGLIGLIAVIGLWRIVEGLSYRRAMIRAFAAQPARPILLRLIRADRWGWQVTDAFNDNRRRFWPLAPGPQPCVLAAGEGLILGATPDHVHLIPVDTAGRWLGLDATELAVLRASLADVGVKHL